MPRNAGSRLLLIATLILCGARSPCRADEVTAASATGKYRLPERGAPGTRASAGGSSWWLAPSGIALALALVGGASLACRRFLPRDGGSPGGLRVVGRTSLSPKHAVHLVRAGDRILMIGTGPQGPPALLGEWPDSRPDAGLDARNGGDE